MANIQNLEERIVASCIACVDDGCTLLKSPTLWKTMILEYLSVSRYPNSGKY